MSTIHFRRSHDLGADRARQVAESVVRDLKSRYGGSHHWDGSVLHFDRGGISGKLAVAEDSIDLRLTLGLVMRPLKGRIEAMVSQRMDELLGKRA